MPIDPSPLPGPAHDRTPLALRLLVAWAHVYVAIVCGWVLLYLVFGDRWWWLFLVNTFALYLFIPWPLLMAAAVGVRRRGLRLTAVAVLAVGLAFCGRPLFPRLSRDARPGPAVTVMTTNILGHNTQTDELVAGLRASTADLIGLLELNPRVAEAIGRELATEYPYQVLDPRSGVTGMGVVSRYPLRETGVSLPGGWVGVPQVLEMDLAGRSVTVVNFHAIPPSLRTPAMLGATIREREHQSRSLVELAESLPGPLIVLGDLNATERSDAYAILSRGLTDAWRAAGWGLGHTFPGSSRPALGGVPIPRWLIRIDYLFFSHHWRASRAWTGPWDGASDHRPVAAKLVLTD